MRSHVRVAVIGGGVVGCSVLYHLTKLGWSDVVLLERDELTSGSSWHAAGGMHTLNSDPNVAKLQDYTIRLYREIEEISGQSCGIHLSGGIMLAGTPERLDFLKTAHARGKVLGLESEFISLEEARRRHPLIEAGQFVGALFDPYEGHIDPSGVTHAYAKAARMAGAEIHRKTPVVELKPEADGGWLVVTPHGTIRAEAVVNAGGLWAREVGRLVGLELPVLAMAHHYLVTEDLPEVLERERGAAALHRLRGRDLSAPGGQGPAARHLRAGLPALGRAHHARRLQPRAARARPGSDRAEPRGRLPALPGGRARRHQAGDQRPVHLRPRRQSPGRTRCRACAISTSPAASWRASRRAAASACRSRTGWSRAIRAWTCSPWTSRVLAISPPAPTPTPRCARTTAGASRSPSRTRSWPPVGRCGPRRSTIV